jgi:hypothetical protein
MESLDLAQFAAEEVHEFLFAVLLPVKIAGPPDR